MVLAWDPVESEEISEGHLDRVETRGEVKSILVSEIIVCVCFLTNISRDKAMTASNTMPLVMWDFSNAHENSLVIRLCLPMQML